MDIKKDKISPSSVVFVESRPSQKFAAMFNLPSGTDGPSSTMSQNMSDVPSTKESSSTPAVPPSSPAHEAESQQSTRAQRSQRSNFPVTREDFHLFPKLPPEIRHMIWRIHYHQSPRIVRLLHPSPTVPYRKDTKPYWLSKAPSLLQINHESRTLGKQMYGPRFTAVKARNTTFFNYDNDIFDFTGTFYEQPGQMPRRNEWSKIQKAIVTGTNTASRLTGLQQVWVMSECKTTQYTEHVCTHKMTDICYAKLQNQVVPPPGKKYAFRHHPIAVFQAIKSEWEDKLQSSMDRRVKRLRKLEKTEFVSPCRLRRKSYAHWGGVDGCGDDKKL